VEVTLAPDAQQLLLSLQDSALKLHLDSVIGKDRVQLREASLTAGKSRLETSGTLQTVDAMEYALKGRLVDFDPTAVLQAVTPPPATPAKGRKRAAAAVSKPIPARINMDFNAAGALSPELKLKLGFRIHDSTYDALPMSGQGDINWPACVSCPAAPMCRSPAIRWTWTAASAPPATSSSSRSTRRNWRAWLRTGGPVARGWHPQRHA
jgi:translocation and assembly module TamB